MLSVKGFCSRLPLFTKIGRFSHSAALYVSYNGHDPDLYHKEYEHMAAMLSGAEIDVVYTKIGSMPPSNFWEHDLYRNSKTVEKTLEIPFSELKKYISDIPTIVSSVGFSRIVFNLCNMQQFFELCHQLRYKNKLYTYLARCPHDIIKHTSADVPIPCHCYSNCDIQWLSSVQYISDMLSHIVIEYPLCIHCVGVDFYPVHSVFDDLYSKAQKILDKQGFIEYKYRHFARDKSHFSQYISLLSFGKQYLGVGPGAHSRIDKGGRLACENSLNLNVWRKQIGVMSKWRAISQYEHVSEMLLHGLDTIDGIQLRSLQKLLPGLENYRRSLLTTHGLKRLVNHGDIVVHGNSIQVPRGRWVNVTSIIADILWSFESDRILHYDDE